MPNETSFASLELHEWRQFRRIEVDLSSRLTVITGANGAGKTTLLSVLGYHFNWQSTFVAGRRRRNRDREFSYIEDGRLTSKQYGGDVEQIGVLRYGNGRRTPLSVPAAYEPTFAISFDDQQAVRGLFINSHRTVAGYRAVDSIPAQFARPSEHLAAFSKEVQSPISGRSSRKTPRLVMKEALLAAALYSESTQAVRADPVAREVWYGFQDLLRQVFPESVGFEGLIVQPPEVLIRTAHGEFPIDGLSGGLTSILEMAWQIHLICFDGSAVTVCIDEPENHLHPSLQRTLVPGLLAAFPLAKFVIATHSPFVVTASPDANVVVLERNFDDLVEARSLDFVSDGVSAEQTLIRVLDVESTLPPWAEERYREVVAKYSRMEPTPPNLRALRHDLEAIGLSAEIPTIIGHWG